jgi:hypothetical protein
VKKTHLYPYPIQRAFSISHKQNKLIPKGRKPAMPRVIHFEIHAHDPERAVTFYTQVFGWKIQKGRPL